MESQTFYKKERREKFLFTPDMSLPILWQALERESNSIAISGYIRRLRSVIFILKMPLAYTYIYV